MDTERKRPVVVVIGVSGSGKTTIGLEVAEWLGAEFAEGDDFHSPANVAKMAAGQPLEDADRYPWLEIVAKWIGKRLREGKGGVVACSALKRRYRDKLREAGPGVWFLHLSTDREVTAERVAARAGHFMPVQLVDSQFDVLEPLEEDEAGAVVDANASIPEVVANATALLEAWMRGES